MASPLVTAFAQAIAQMEGYNTTGTIAARNLNPGNLRSGPNQSGTANGYAVYSSAAAGWADLYSQIQTNFNRGLNTYQFFGGGLGYPGYAPAADSNSPNTYAVFVAAQLGIDPTVPLNSLDPNTYASTAAPITNPITSTTTATPVTTLLCADGTAPLADGTCDDGSSPGATSEIYTPASSLSVTDWTTVGLTVGIAVLLWLWFRD